MPIINLYGNSDLGKEFFVKEFLKENAEYLRLYSDEKDKIEIILEKTTNIGLFSKECVIDLIDFDNWKLSEKREIFNLNIPDSLTIFLRTVKPIKNEIKGLELEVKSESFTVPNPWEKKKWLLYIKSLIEKEGLEFDEKVPEFLFEIVGPDEYALFNEISKLKVLGEKLTIEIIEEFVHKHSISKLDEFCFMISEKNRKAFEKLHEILNDYDETHIISAVAKHFIFLFNIVLSVEYKEKYNWNEIKEYARKMNVSLPKVARFLGFKFSGQEFTPVNHVKLYNVEELKEIIKKIYFIERSIKSGGTLNVEIVEFMEQIMEEG
ncbi:MAG: DNA polymerase III subunit delta [Thermosipho sp. (in: Bacteria)]|nr:DNA polymerase III subunit delta [Thermosipho sp. (in: thermotogales)]